MKSLIESVRATLAEKAEEKLDEGRMKELHGYIEKGMSAKDIAKKMRLDVKTIQALMPKKESVEEIEERTAADCKEMVCKNCGDKFGMPTEGSCMYDSKDPNGKNWKDGDMNEAMDPVDQKAVKKKFDDRKDKDIDNDGDVDSSDEYLHKKRKAISKSKNKEDEPEGEKGETATMNPKKETKESTIRDKLMSIWEDAAGAKRKKDQNRDEQPTDRNASAKTMKDGHPVDTTSKLTDYDELGHDDASKAGRAGPSPKSRTNDSKIGDKAIINKIASAYKGMKNGD